MTAICERKLLKNSVHRRAGLIVLLVSLARHVTWAGVSSRDRVKSPRPADLWTGIITRELSAETYRYQSFFIFNAKQW